MTLVLGSSSPRRQQLITKLGLPFLVLKPGYEEVLEDGISAKDYVKKNSVEKGKWLFTSESKAKDKLIITADTIVVLNDQILQKPIDTKDAFTMLKQLSGNKHSVFTSICLTGTSGKQLEKTVITDVYFRSMEDSEIELYIKTGEPMDKAGSYGIQGIGSDFVEKIEGSMSNVIGLPVKELSDLLNRFKDQ